MSTESMVTQADRDAAEKFFPVFDRPSAHEALARAFARHREAAQSEREAVLEEALLRCASRFTDYADLHAEKLWDGSLSEVQRQTIRDKVDRNLRYAAEARAALKTTPAPAEGDDLTDEQWAKVLENAPKPNGPLIPAPVVSTDAEPLPVEYYLWLASIEPDVRVRDLTAEEVSDLLSRIRGEGE